MDKILRVNLTNGAMTTVPVPGRWRKLTGRALTSTIVYEEVPPTCHPLDGSKNKLVFSPGFLSTSFASSAGRISVGGKSPLTGGIKESNSGGTLAAAIGNLGYRAIVLEGESHQWQVLVLTKDGMALEPADDLVGRTSYGAAEALRGRYGQRIAMAVIGPAGEFRLPAAAVMVTDMDGVPSRPAARGGLGAVMGSKRLKAIVVDSGKVKRNPPAYPEKLHTAVKRFARALMAHPASGKSLPIYGTDALVGPINKLGGLPTRNFRSGSFEGAAGISGEQLREIIVARGGKATHPCMPGCVIRCSNVYPGPDGDERVRGLEFETIVLNGSNLSIDSLDVVAELNRLCNLYGLDTIEIGAAMGVAMDGGLLSFGDGAGAVNMLKEIGKGTPLGRLIGSGAVAVGHALGVTHVPAVKGQAMAAYDPRRLKGTGVTYATSPMGADHTAGNCLPNTVLPGVGPIDTTKREHQVELSRYLQKVAAVFDSLGLCWFSRYPILDDPTLLLDMLKAQTGDAWTWDGLLDLGWQTVQTEVMFNQAAGFTEADDRLPDFFREEPLPPTDDTFDIPQSEVLQTLKP